MVGPFGRKKKCQTCGAEFDSEGKLMEHAKMHMQTSSQRGADTYNCATCGAAFTSEAHLDEHTRKAHLDFFDLSREKAARGDESERQEGTTETREV
jgi:DNA-directed RNA polymerase subunit RPC12/RpoP